MALTELTGSVVKHLIAKGSKSEREAVLLMVGEKQYILRQRGGNPFSDPVLDDLVGKNLKAEGQILGTVFILDDWEVVSS